MVDRRVAIRVTDGWSTTSVYDLWSTAGGVCCPDAPCCHERLCLHLAFLTSREATVLRACLIRASNASESHRRHEVLGLLRLISVVGRHGVELVTALRIREHRNRLKGGRRGVGRRQLSTSPHELINELCESETASWVGLHDDEARPAQPNRSSACLGKARSGQGTWRSVDPLTTKVPSW